MNYVAQRQKQLRESSHEFQTMPMAQLMTYITQEYENAEQQKLMIKEDPDQQQDY